MAALTVAHRGDPYLHRENTLPSLVSAVRAGADAVEMDVRLTSDGIPVLLHDPTLKRLWGHAVAVADLSCERVRQLTDGGVPTLDEALGAVEGARALLDLTLPESADAVLHSVRSCGAETRTYSCGETAALLAVRDRDPNAEIALTWKSSSPPLSALIDEVRPRWLNLRFGLVRPELVHWAHERGLLVAVWTADTRCTMRRLHRMGVDSITTNRVSTLRRLLDG
jgi:glycerophosphoryl diester phosphodiesterase